MKKIKLGTKNLYTLVDDSDYAWLKRYSWFFLSGYATREESRKRILMHRQIMDTPKGMETDHINGNKLDNQRSNLRICTQAENNLNRTKRANTTSIYKGVHWHSYVKQWQAKITVNKSLKLIGYFKNERHAALAYDLWSVELHGKYGKRNFQVVGSPKDLRG